MKTKWIVQCIYGGYLLPNGLYTKYKKKARVYARKPKIYDDERLIPVAGALREQAHES